MKATTLLVILVILLVSYSLMNTANGKLKGSYRASSSSTVKRKVDLSTSGRSDASRKLKTTKVTKIKYFPEQNNEIHSDTEVQNISINTFSKQAKGTKTDPSSAVSNSMIKGKASNKGTKTIKASHSGNQYTQNQSELASNSMIKAKAPAEGTKASNSVKSVFRNVSNQSYLASNSMIKAQGAKTTKTSGSTGGKQAKNSSIMMKTVKKIKGLPTSTESIGDYYSTEEEIISSNNWFTENVPGIEDGPVEETETFKEEIDNEIQAVEQSQEISTVSEPILQNIVTKESERGK